MPFTHADTLRGTYGPERDWWDVLKYDLHVKIEIMGVFQRLNAEGITIVMVTHELDIARYTKRNVIMRDGCVVSDTVVTNRLDAGTEMAKLKQEQQSVQLTP